MDHTLTGVWPSGAPQTLWNYHLLQAEELPLLPLMSWRIERGFAIAFAFGVVFIAVFAWRRFKERSFDPELFDYRVIKELDPTELRGPSAMRQAYLIYVGVLLTLYVAMTFFGKLILQTAGSLPIAGTQVDVSSLNFSSPQWPLLLAFGFAGFAPMIKPLEIAETWLRERAHRAVGIPVKIRQITEKLIENLERLPDQGMRAGARRSVPAWITRLIGKRDSIDRILRVADDLDRLLVWQKKDRSAWPDDALRDKLRKLERAVAGEAETVLQDFDELIRQGYDALPNSGGGASARAGKKGNDELRAHQKRLELQFSTIVKRMEELRNELASILAVYAERDPDFSDIGDPTLSDLLERTLAPSIVRRGPEMPILVSLPLVFAIYAFGVTFDVHPLLFQVERVPLTVLATAGLETLRFAALFWLPITGAFALRQFLADKHLWNVQNLGERFEQRTAAGPVGLLASIMGLFLLALSWAALIAINGVRFQELLFRGPAPFMLFYPTQAAMVVPYLAFTLMAADTGPDRRRLRILLGMVSAAAVAVCMGGHLHFWYSGQSCEDGAPFLSDLFASVDCFQEYGGIDYLLYPLVAFLAASVFGAQMRGAGAALGRWPHAIRPDARPALAGAVAVVALFAAAHSAQAGPEPVGGDAPTDIVVGFRADAEPFSYRILIDGEERFVGYIADLCYDIFASSTYRVTSVAVTAADRFSRVRQDDPGWRPSTEPAIDVLCDPVTLRFSEPDERATVGVFSPIVFASGVSYLYRRTRGVEKPVYLGYVENSTAAPVAKRTCEIDLLRVREPNAAQPCVVPDRVGDSGIACPDPSYKPLPTEMASYRFCVLPSHDELVKWFCARPVLEDSDGQVERELPFQVAYFGDRDLILGKLASYRAQGNVCPAAEIEEGAGNLTYEPYALVVAKTNPDLIQHVQRRVYEFFSHRSEARGLFHAYFPDRQMSLPLAYLFLLNAVTEEDVFRRPFSEDEGHPGPAISDGTAPAGARQAFVAVR